MSQATTTMSDGTLNGHQEREAGAAGRVLVARQVPRSVEVACRFARARQRKAVVFMLGAGDSTGKKPDIPITRLTAEQLERSIADERFDGLDLIIQSSGGDIHAAYLIMSILRGRMNDKATLTACVPSRAQSAATLLCLGADEILLGELGALGPLDAQIRRGITDIGTPNFVSALHLLKALDRLEEFSQTSFNAMAANLDAHQASRDDQVRYGIEFSRAITGPLFGRIDSEQVGAWDQTLLTGEEYGCRLLRRGALVKDDDVEAARDDHIKSIVHQLVFGCPSHELIIDRDALTDLHLRAAVLPQQVRPIAREFSRCASETLIMLVDPEGAPAPEDSDEIPLKRWPTSGTEQARDIVWSHEGATFAMRVGLYRRAVTTSNPWQNGEAAGGAPAAQYSVPLGYTGMATQYKVPLGFTGE